MPAGTFAHIPRIDDYVGARTRQKVLEYTGPSTYTTGGDAGLKGLCNFAEITKVEFMPLLNGATTAKATAAKYGIGYAIDADKIFLNLFSTDAEVANGADASDGKWRVIVYGS